MPVSVLPVGTVSFTVLAPKLPAVKVWPPSLPDPPEVVIVGLAAPLKLKVPSPPVVDLSIVNFALFTLVKVQVTSSPALITAETAVSPVCQVVSVFEDAVVLVP